MHQTADALLFREHDASSCQDKPPHNFHKLYTTPEKPGSSQQQQQQYQQQYQQQQQQQQEEPAARALWHRPSNSLSSSSLTQSRTGSPHYRSPKTLCAKLRALQRVFQTNSCMTPCYNQHHHHHQHQHYQHYHEHQQQQQQGKLTRSNVDLKRLSSQNWEDDYCAAFCTIKLAPAADTVILLQATAVEKGQLSPPTPSNFGLVGKKASSALPGSGKMTNSFSADCSGSNIPKSHLAENHSKQLQQQQRYACSDRRQQQIYATAVPHSSSAVLRSQQCVKEQQDKSNSRHQQGQLSPPAAAWDNNSSSSSNAMLSQAAAAAPYKPKPPTSSSSSSPHKHRPGVQLRHSLPAAAFSKHFTSTAAAVISSASTAAAAKARTQQQTTLTHLQHPSGDNRNGRPIQQQEQQQCCSIAQATAAAAVIHSSTATAPGSVCSTVCSPIAIAKHCPEDLQPQTWQPVDFVQTRKLYEGKIALVVEGYHAATRRPLALKVYNRAALDVMEKFQLAHEVCLHLRCCHAYITSLYAAYKDSRHIYLLMELAPQGNLYQMLMAMQVSQGEVHRLPEHTAVPKIISPLLTALHYLHQQGIIHRDIKLENVLLSADGTIKLADFGLSIDTQHEPANTRLGTQGYFAPEVLALPLKASPFEAKSPHEAASRPSYNCKADVWSAGVVCYEVLTGRAPFAADNAADVLQAILHRRLVYPGHLSPQAVSFLQAALTRNPTTRATADQLLKHEFIKIHLPHTAK